MMRPLCLAALVALVAGCATTPAEDPFVGWNKDYRTCRAEYAEIDAKVKAAGVGDAGYYRVPGYPYLRTDRTLASFAHEVKTIDEIGGWLRKMREFDQEAREFEFMNLGLTLQDRANQRARFLNCGRVLAGIEFLDNPDALAKLQAAVKPVDEYSTAQRVLGFHALAAPGLRAGIAASQQALDAAYTTPVDQLPATAPLQLWTPRPEADLSLIAKIYARVYPDELGFPGLTDSQWRALAEQYAPQLWIETASAADHIAMPVLGTEGASADPATPHVHFFVGFARVGGKPVAQLQYLFWFKGADAGAPIDGFIWRVTLDDKAQPLVLESMHTSGRDHRWYPVQALTRRERNGDAQGIPVVAPESAPAQRATLRIEAGTHRILRVLRAEEVGANPTTLGYSIRRYDDLLMLPYPGGGTRSLFDAEGLVRGSPSNGGFSSGIPAFGALRQLGHHPITPIGRAHFDDPFLLESVFVPPGS